MVQLNHYQKLCKELSFVTDSVLSGTQFIESNFTALLGGYIFYLESKNIKVKINKPEKGRVYTTLCKNNFLIQSFQK